MRAETIGRTDRPRGRAKTLVGALVVALVAPLSTALTATPAAASLTVWDQFGGDSEDYVVEMVADATGNVYATGIVDDGVGVETGGDVFVRKYSSTGTLLWQDNFGSDGWDWANAIALDGSGDVYVAGGTPNNLGGTNAGANDAFVRKYSASSGTVLWTRQFGTSADDGADGVGVDSSGNVYVLGWTDGALEGTNAGLEDVFVRKYSSGGSVLWTDQFGTAGYDWSYAGSADASGNFYVTFEQNAVSSVRKYLATSSDGSHAWETAMPTGFGEPRGLAVASGNVYVAGTTGSEGYVRSYDSSSGTFQNGDQFRVASSDEVRGVAVDGSGNVFVVGWTTTDVAGPHIGGADGFIRRYDASLALVWQEQFGTLTHDKAYAVAAYGSGNLYVGGETDGALEGTNAGYYDAFIGKIVADPPVAPTVTDQPSDDYVRVGELASFWADGTSVQWVLNYQWQVNPGSGWTDIPGATSDTLEFTAAMSDDGNLYRMALTNGAGPVYSQAALLTVADNEITISDATISKGQVTVTFSSTGTPALGNFECDLGHGKNPWIPCTSGVAVKGSGKTVTVRGYDTLGNPAVESLAHEIIRQK